MRRLCAIFLLLLPAPLLADNCASLPAAATLSDDGLLRTPMMGWNSWYPYGSGSNLTEAHIKAQADALVSTGLKAAGYTWVNVDDGWPAASRDGSGNIVADATKFPSGMAVLATYVHTNGLNFGLYSSPNTTTCAGFMGSGNHESADASTFAGWQIDSLKYDGCSVDTLYTSCYSYSAPRVWQMMAQDIRTTGRAIALAIGFVPSQPSNMKDWAKSSGYDDWRIDMPQDVNGVWGNFDAAMDLAATDAQSQKVGYWANCDYMQGTSAGWSQDAAQTQFSLCAGWGGPLVIGQDLTTMSGTNIAMYSNSEIIAVDQDASGKMAVRVSHTACGSSWCDVWAKPLHDGTWAMVLVNRDSATHTVTVDFSNFGKTPSVRDIVGHTSLGTMSSYSVSIVGVGSKMLKVTPPQTGTTQNNTVLLNATAR